MALPSLGSRRSAFPERRLPVTNPLARVGIEADLQQSQPVVVVLPEEVLQARSEQAHGRRAARQLGRAPRYEANRRESGGHVAEVALARAAHEHLVVGRAEDCRRARGGIDERRAGGYFGLSTRRAERACPDRVGAWDREGEGGLAIRSVLVEHLEHAVGRLTEQNLRRHGVAARAEAHEDDVAAPFMLGLLSFPPPVELRLECRPFGAPLPV